MYLPWYISRPRSGDLTCPAVGLLRHPTNDYHPKYNSQRLGYMLIHKLSLYLGTGVRTQQGMPCSQSYFLLSCLPKRVLLRCIACFFRRDRVPRSQRRDDCAITRGAWLRRPSCSNTGLSRQAAKHWGEQRSRCSGAGATRCAHFLTRLLQVAVEVVHAILV